VHRRRGPARPRRRRPAEARSRRCRMDRPARPRLGGGRPGRGRYRAHRVVRPPGHSVGVDRRPHPPADGDRARNLAAHPRRCSAGPHTACTSRTCSSPSSAGPASQSAFSCSPGPGPRPERTRGSSRSRLHRRPSRSSRPSSEANELFGRLVPYVRQGLCGGWRVVPLPALPGSGCRSGLDVVREAPCASSALMGGSLDGCRRPRTVGVPAGGGRRDYRRMGRLRGRRHCQRLRTVQYPTGHVRAPCSPVRRPGAGRRPRTSLHPYWRYPARGRQGFSRRQGRRHPAGRWRVQGVRHRLHPRRVRAERRVRWHDQLPVPRQSLRHHRRIGSSGSRTERPQTGDGSGPRPRHRPALTGHITPFGTPK
jgi:hypothetical protein